MRDVKAAIEKILSTPAGERVRKSETTTLHRSRPLAAEGGVMNRTEIILTLYCLGTFVAAVVAANYGGPWLALFFAGISGAIAGGLAVVENIRLAKLKRGDRVDIPAGLLRDLIWSIRPHYSSFGGVAGENDFKHAFHTRQAAENVLARFEKREPEDLDYKEWFI